MAKGQNRSNREVRKPKQEKAQPKPESTFGSQIKMAASSTPARGKANEPNSGSRPKRGN